MASLPYPRSHKTIFPQNSRNTETTGGEEKSVYICEIRGRLFYARSFCVFCEFRGRTLRSLTICVHLCASVGGYSPPEASVYSVQSVGEYPPPEASVNSVGGLAQANLEWVLWKEFGGWRGYGRDAIPSYENSHGLHGCAQIRRVWHPCHTHAATKLSSHRTLRSLTICAHLCASVGGSSPPEASVYICEIRWRISSARNFCEFREFRGRTCASKLRVGSVEGIRRVAWVWQGCHTLLLL